MGTHTRRSRQATSPAGSILFRDPELQAQAQTAVEPACFRDLNLDQLVAAATRGRVEHNLTPFFSTPLPDPDAVGYRHEVMRDLEDDNLRDGLTRFATGMRMVRRQRALAAGPGHEHQQAIWFLRSALTYCRAVTGLAEHLSAAELESRGFRGLLDHLRGYLDTPDFTQLRAGATKLHDDLAGLRYGLVLNGNRISVTTFEGEPDYGHEVVDAFAPFGSADVTVRPGAFAESADLNHVEASILDGVAKLHKDVFSRLAKWRSRHTDYLADPIVTFDREVQFYLAYRDLIAPLQRAGLPFCYPQVTDDARELAAADTFDLALATKLAARGEEVVTNDVALSDHERIVVVTGPNQGGKTTFARTFGQLHVLAALGCPVPGREVRLPLADRVLTHFSRAETLEDLHGALEDDLLRVRKVLDAATPHSVVVINELFGSTTLVDATQLGRQVLERVAAMDVRCVYVTFVDELSTFGPSTASLVTAVDPADPSVRTFKVERRPADGRAYAEAIARKYGLTYDRLRDRIQP